MKRVVRFRNGLKLNGMKCPWCRSKKRATVMQNRIRWTLRFNCGHVRVYGYLMPMDVLEDQGLANYKQSEDPRYASKKAHMDWEREKERKDMEDFMKRHEEGTSLKGGRILFNKPKHSIAHLRPE